MPLPLILCYNILGGLVMKESMHYLTNYYQLREFVLIRMLEIIKQRYYAKENGVVFFW